MGHPGLAGDAWYAFEQILAIAIREKIPRVVLGGDGWDNKRPDPESVYRAGAAIDTYIANGGDFQFVQGDHDYCLPVPWFKAAHPRSRWLVEDPDVWKIKGEDYTVLGLDYQPADKLAEAVAAATKEAHILVTHQKWNEFIGFDASTTTRLAETTGITRTIVTGDFHRSMSIKVKTVAGHQLQVLSPGVTCMQAIDECEFPSVMVLYDDGSIETRELKARPVLRLHPDDNEVAFQETLQHISGYLKKAPDKTLPDDLQKPIIQVVYGTHNVETPLARLREVVGRQAFLFDSETGKETERVLEADLEALAQARAGGLKAALENRVRTLDPADQEVLLRIGLSLLDAAEAGELKETLDRLEQENTGLRKSKSMSAPQGCLPVIAPITSIGADQSPTAGTTCVLGQRPP